MSIVKITATHINLYHICRRELWLHANQITMEHNSDLVKEGKLIGENTYPQRPLKGTELDLGVAKIDFYDAKTQTVHEIKKSNKKEEAHKAQVKYYLYLLRKIGVENPSAILEYPTLRISEKIVWDDAEDVPIVEKWMAEVEDVLEGDCPPKIQKSKCQKCSYFDFCWIEEV